MVGDVLDDIVFYDQNFDSKQDAIDWMVSVIGDENYDNFRFCYAEPSNDKEYDEFGTYEDRMLEGCCGSFDAEVEVNSRRVFIGCNFGH